MVDQFTPRRAARGNLSKECVLCSQCCHKPTLTRKSNMHMSPRKALVQGPHSACRRSHLRQHLPHATGTQVAPVFHSCHAAGTALAAAFYFGAVCCSVAYNLEQALLHCQSDATLIIFTCRVLCGRLHLKTCHLLATKTRHGSCKLRIRYKTESRKRSTRSRWSEVSKLSLMR